MQKGIFSNTIKYVLAFTMLLFASTNTANCGELLDSKDIVVSRLNLINQIIDDPKAANMSNWIILGNPHDESELKFYMNSISNGASPSYDQNKNTMQRLVEHSRSTSEDEPSILLQYLRLSLMAYNIRPGAAPPSFKFSKLSQYSQNEVVVACDFRFIDASGNTVIKKAEIFFDIGDNPKSDLFLQKIIIDGRISYGGW